MKQVLLIDESSIFRDYIKNKLDAKHIGVDIGVGQLDSMSKMRSLLPDIVILDFNLNRNFVFDLLDSKKTDPNAKDIPVLLLAQKIEKEEITRLAQYGIKKIIPKPLKIDQLFNAITEIIHVDFEIDNTPCILEARVNDNILFIEIAQGLNREKIELLKYKIKELISLYNLYFPKILVMMTDLTLSFIDSPNLELLLDSIMADSTIRNKNIKVLTLDSFTRQFIEGNKEYADILVANDLSKALDSLLKDSESVTDKSSLISERILTLSTENIPQEETLEMRFKSELEALKSLGQDIRIAVVDDDIVIRTVLEKTFQTIHAKVDKFESGNAFISKVLAQTYDLIFLDLIMPGMNGFEVLLSLKENEITTPVIVLSAVSKREAVIKVLSSGVKSYMIKPLKPDTLLKKTIEVLQESF